MKLVELLVQELPKRSGWPVGADYVVQDCDGSYDLKFGAGKPTVYLSEGGVWRNSEKPRDWGVYTEESYIRDVTVGADDADTSIVLREEYEALLTKGDKSTMKLIDILVEELPLRGGWIEGVEVITQDDDGSLCLWGQPGVNATQGYWRHPTGQALKAYWSRSHTVSLAEDRGEAVISQEDYEAALVKGNKTQLKLIDLLVQELPKHGGWPTSADYAGYKKSAGDIRFVFGGKPGFTEDGNLSIFANADKGTRWVVGEYISAQAPEDCETAFVSREEYLAALKASKQHKWDGEGLPPIGAEIEVLSPSFGWKAATVTAVTDNWLVAQYEDGAEYAGAHRILERDGSFTNRTDMFRKGKSQAECEREATVASLQESLKGSGYGLPDGAASIIVDAIAQGKVSGIKLAD